MPHQSPKPAEFRTGLLAPTVAASHELIADFCQSLLAIGRCGKNTDSDVSNIKEYPEQSQMPRPQSVTDEEIVRASHQVLVRRGHDAFTLSEVADEVGLSRAAVTLRFKSAEALKFLVINANVERFLAHLEDLPKSPSGNNLIEIAAFLGRLIGHSANSSPMAAVFSGNILSDDLAALEEKRRGALLAAIARCMPETKIKHETACAAFLSHLSGAIMAWQPREGDDPCAFLMDRAKEWLTLARIPFSEDYKGVWAHNPPTPLTSPGTPRRQRKSSNGAR